MLRNNSSTRATFNSRLGPRLWRLVQYVAVPFILLVAWQLAVEYGWVPRTLIAGRVAVAQRLIEMASDGTLLRHVGVSLGRLASGFAIGTSLGILVGVLVAFRPAAARLLEPTILSLIPIPPIAWIPLLIILLGIGESAKVALISIGSFCTLFLQTAYGIRTGDRTLVEMARALNKGDRALLWRVLFPGVLPGILASMRVALALSWTLLIASEVIASSSGLGWLIWNARNFSRPSDMFVGMVTVGMLGKCSDWGLVALEARLTRWRRSFRDG
jgi:ABC-type nitrate/sulfonate/bicarbonate transport system permease component